MKTLSFKIDLILILLFITNSININCQDSIDNKMRIIDLKLELLDSKLELLDSKMKTWEVKPEELDIRLNDLDIGFRELESKLVMLDFDPESINYRFSVIDSVLLMQQKNTNIVEINNIVAVNKDSIKPIAVKSVISLNPVRIFEGTFQLSYEIAINSGNSIDFSGLATYATNEGISRAYLSKQEMSYFNTATNTYDPYTSNSIYGFGSIVQWKNYLLARTNPKYNAPIGLYAASSLMYRRLWISGFQSRFNEETNNYFNEEITQKLNIFAGGVIIGMQISFIKSISLDIYAGGVMRLSLYDNEMGFTKYKKWDNIDFSGVLPAAGIKIGILK